MLELLASVSEDGSPARKLASSGHRASEPSSSSSCCTRGALTSGGGGGGIGAGTLGPPEPCAASLLRGSCTPGVQVFRQQRHILASQTEPSHATTSMRISAFAHSRWSRTKLKGKPRRTRTCIELGLFEAQLSYVFLRYADRYVVHRAPFFPMSACLRNTLNIEWSPHQIVGPGSAARPPCSR